MPEYRFDRKNHLHLLDGRPLTGTTTVGGVLSKPLTWWAAELAAIECLDKGWCVPGIKASYEAAVAAGRKSEKAQIAAMKKLVPVGDLVFGE